MLKKILDFDDSDDEGQISLIDKWKEQMNLIKEIMKEIESSKNIYINEDTYDFHIIPLTHISDNNKKFILFKGLDEIYFKKNEKEKIKTVTDDIFKIVNKHIKHENEKLSKLQENLYKNENYEQDKEYGDLLFMQENLDIKGKKDITIENTKISLDPKLTIKQNANKYYQKFTKKKKGISYIKEQIAGFHREEGCQAAALL